MKTSSIPAILLFLSIFVFSCENAEINYANVNCSGSVETSETFSKNSLSYTDLGGYEYIFDYTSIALSIPIEDCCPSKPVKVDFTCHLDASDTTEVFVGLSVYNGFKTQLGSADLEWNADVDPDLIQGSGEFTVEGKSTETTSYIQIEMTVGLSDVNPARDYLIRIFRDYNLTVTYSKLD